MSKLISSKVTFQLLVLLITLGDTTKATAEVRLIGEETTPDAGEFAVTLRIEESDTTINTSSVLYTDKTVDACINEVITKAMSSGISLTREDFCVFIHSEICKSNNSTMTFPGIPRM